MKATFLHVGIPVTNKKPGMVYNEVGKLWATDPAEHALKFEYLKFEEGTPFPEFLHKNPHVAYMVDEAAPVLAEANQVLFGPAPGPDETRMYFIVKDDTLIELLEKKPLG